jgi:hypothetical protein
LLKHPSAKEAPVATSTPALLAALQQVRILALCEAGTHVLYRWLCKPCRRNEAPMTPYLPRWLRQDMLLIWDRAFLCHELAALVLARGARLLARAKANGRFEPIEALPDGSYLARLLPRDQRRTKGREGVVARVIDYRLGDPGRPSKEKRHRPVTTLPDAQAHPAEELVLKILRLRLAEVPRSPTGRKRWWEELLLEVGEEVLPARRGRVNPRVIKREMGNWPKKRPQHRNLPQPTMPFRESIAIT